MSDWLIVTLRTLLAVVVIFIITKLIGKRQISQLSFFEYVTGITIGSITAYISLDLESKWYLGIVALVVWAGVSIGLEYATLKSKIIRDLVDGKGTVIVKEGKVMEDNLKKVRLTSDELLEQLRGKNAFKLADVEFATMESNGQLSVLLNKQNQPLTAQHLGIKVGPEQEPQTVIMDGEIMEEPLATAGLNRGWLKTELDKLGIPVENVFLGQVDSYGELTVDLFDDQIMVPQPQQKAVLLATLKKCEADIEMFGLSTKDKSTKLMYQRCSEQLQAVIKSVKPILTR